MGETTRKARDVQDTFQKSDVSEDGLCCRHPIAVRRKMLDALL
jgi:hypothetical protein